jgi:hypothetical protein
MMHDDARRQDDAEKKITSNYLIGEFSGSLQGGGGCGSPGGGPTVGLVHRLATVESMAGPFLGPYRAAVDLIASAADATKAKAYVVGMVVP